MLEKLMDLLGEKNVQRLQDGITDIILEQMKDDFADSSEYILSPDDVIEFAERCKEKAFNSIEQELINKMKDDLRKSLSLQCGQ